MIVLSPGTRLKSQTKAITKKKPQTAGYEHRLYYTVVSHSPHITLRWPISIHVRKDIPFYLNDPVL